MDVLNTIGMLTGTILGAAFLLGGGLLLPLWQLGQERDAPSRRRV